MAFSVLHFLFEMKCLCPISELSIKIYTFVTGWYIIATMPQIWRNHILMIYFVQDLVLTKNVGWFQERCSCPRARKAAGLLDRPGLQVSEEILITIHTVKQTRTKSLWFFLVHLSNLLFSSMVVAPVEPIQDTTTENSTLPAGETVEEEEVDTFLQV